MVPSQPHRKRLKRFHEPGDIHELTFSVYQRMMQAVQASIDYIHTNPVKRGLCLKNRDWRWSSARYYESDGQVIDPLHPIITPLPAEFWLGG